jgi:hypothetical protein
MKSFCPAKKRVEVLVVKSLCNLRERQELSHSHRLELIGLAQAAISAIERTVASIWESNAPRLSPMHLTVILPHSACRLGKFPFSAPHHWAAERTGQTWPAVCLGR